METFLVKSALSMAVLLALYHLLLEREKMHRFNRFYLLGALVFSLVMPFITVTTYYTEANFTTDPFTTTVTNQSSSTSSIDYISYMGWGIYAAVTLVLVIRFIANIFCFIKKGKQNQMVAIEGARLVLLEEKVLPHTFMNTIFVNRKEYANSSIEDELYTHEFTHVRQRHTLDILFIEALKTIFWFNPLLYFYKRAMQLNHEFLADEKVINTTANTVYYQNLLLEKASIGTTFSLASNLNFSITKKRFFMMTKSTSTAKAAILKIAITPVIAGLMMLLCTKTVAQETSKATHSNTRKTEISKTAKSQSDLAKKESQDSTNKKAVAPNTTKDKLVEVKKENDTIHYDKQTDPETKTYKLSGPVHLNDGRTKSIETNSLTQEEIDALKKHDPKTYNDITIKDYVAVRYTYINDEGKLITQTMFKKKSELN